VANPDVEVRSNRTE